MSLTFPTNPTDGQVYPEPALAGFPQFQWNNTTKTWIKLDSSLATETKVGVAEIATQAEVNAGTDDSRFVTPLKLNTRLNSLNNYVSDSELNSAIQYFPCVLVAGSSPPSQRPNGSSLEIGDLWFNQTGTPGKASGLYVWGPGSSEGTYIWRTVNGLASSY